VTDPLPIPDHLKNLPEITADEIRKMTEEGNVRFEGKVVQGDALEALHGALFKGVSVHVERSLIDGDLDFTKGPKVELEEVERFFPKLKEALSVRKQDREKRPFIIKPLGTEKFPQEHKEGFTGTLRDVKMVVLVRGSLIIERSTINGRVLAERTAFLSLSFIMSRFNLMVSFWGAKFVGEVSFEQAIFVKGAIFDGSHFVERADFEFTDFEEWVTFGGSTFVEWVTFDFATFGHGPYFFHVIFGKGVSFDHATFEEDAYFLGATFEGPTVFRGRGAVEETNGIGKPEDNFLFKGDVNFAAVTFKAPVDVIFERVDLSQAYFRETHLDRVRFIDVKWDEIDGRRALHNERNLKKEDYGLLAQLYRQLKKNYEEERDYPGAGDFHYGEMEMTRKQYRRAEKWYDWLFTLEPQDEGKSKKFRWNPNWFNLLLTTVYKHFSGYGEKPGLAFVWIGVILIVPALVYFIEKLVVTPNSGLVSSFAESLTESLAYMTVRLAQKPFSAWGKVFKLLQAILGPFQIALVALALRRKFRR